MTENVWRACLVAVAFLGAAQVNVVRAGDGCPVTTAQVRRMSVCELDSLFAAAEGCELPAGLTKGKVLVLADTHCPRLRARLAGSVWKGKCFADNGSFVNRWLGGVQAIHACAVCGASWLDGKPCLAMDYEPGTPIFGNTRDELRRIGPGLYLGRMYDRCPCPKFRGYFLLETTCAH